MAVTDTAGGLKLLPACKAPVPPWAPCKAQVSSKQLLPSDPQHHCPWLIHQLGALHREQSWRTEPGGRQLGQARVKWSSGLVSHSSSQQQRWGLGSREREAQERCTRAKERAQLGAANGSFLWAGPLT